MIIRVTKEFDFEAAHALDNYDGKCKDIHGHSYHLKVTLSGRVKEDKSLPDCGMVIDFSEVKQVIRQEILPIFDHRLLLREDSRFRGLEAKNERIRYVGYQPTCENMLLEIVHILQNQFPDGVRLEEVMLRETATSYAEWRYGDNL